MTTTKERHLLRDADLSTLRGIPPPATAAPINVKVVERLPGLMMGDHALDELADNSDLEEDLEALAELVPGLRTGKVGVEAVIQQESQEFDLHLLSALLPQPTGPTNPEDDRQSQQKDDCYSAPYDRDAANNNAEDDSHRKDEPDSPNMDGVLHITEEEEEEEEEDEHSPFRLARRKAQTTTTPREPDSEYSDDPATLNQLYKETSSTHSAHPPATQSPFGGPAQGITQEPSISAASTATLNDAHTNATSSQNSPSRPGANSRLNMPMHLPNFKPATGCTNASDFIVRCFVARLRAGITVIKHGRSRWAKSQLRTLHLLSDGKTLTWRPAVHDASPAFASRRRRPTELDLLSCTEVRHAWSADPSNPMFTGTPILRMKCEAAFAHKSFALIFEKRSLDITAVTADQCKVLLEGFSALCFRLQLAQLNNNVKNEPLGEEEEEKKKVEDDGTTASNTLTNNSTAVVQSGSGASKKGKKPLDPLR